MKIVHLTSCHPVGDTRILQKEAATVAAAGHEVVLVAPAERDTILRGVRVRAVTPGRSRLLRMTWTVAEVLWVAFTERADIYQFHDAELIPVGLCLKLSRRCVIYDFHDDLPAQVLSKYWIPPRLRPAAAWLLARLLSSVSRLFDAIVLANPAHANRFPTSRTIAVRNLPDLAEFPLARELKVEREPAVVYVGSLTRVRGVLEMVQAMALLPASCSARLWLGGRFAEPGLEATCRAQPGWERVDFIGWLDRTEVAERLGRARIGLVLLHPTPQHHTSYATKLFEYMAAGLPVVASDLPINREIVDEAGCAMLVDALDPAAAAQAMLWLLEHPAEAEAMGRRGRTAVEQHHNWETEARALVSLYDRLRPPQPASTNTYRPRNTL